MIPRLEGASLLAIHMIEENINAPILFPKDACLHECKLFENQHYYMKIRSKKEPNLSQMFEVLDCIPKASPDCILKASPDIETSKNGETVLNKATNNAVPNVGSKEQNPLLMPPHEHNVNRLKGLDYSRWKHGKEVDNSDLLHCHDSSVQPRNRSSEN